MHDGPVSSAKIFAFEAKQCKISNELKGTDKRLFFHSHKV